MNKKSTLGKVANSYLTHTEKNRGITLIALVVTIILLLILAGVSISMLTGQNGILNRASEAKEKTELGQKQEKSDMAGLEDLINESVDGTSVEQVSDKNPGVLEQDELDRNVYSINSIEDLVFFAYDVGNNDNTYEGKTVKLGLSLDFNSSKSYVDAFRTDYGKYGYNGELKTLLTSGEGFLPIGNISDGNCIFKGTFDGAGHNIRTLFINKVINDNTSTKTYQVGFFVVSSGVIKNFGLEKINVGVEGKNNVGISTSGLVARNYGDIENCYVTGSLKGETDKGNINVSGIVGQNHKNISNSYNKASITGSTNGGYTYISGVSAGNKSDAVINSCYNMGNILMSGNIDQDKYALCGGITGGQEGGKITNCYNGGEIKADSESDAYRVGGLIGNCNGIVENSYNYGKVNAKYEINTGAIAGSINNDNTAAKLDNCYCLGEVINNGNGNDININKYGVIIKKSDELKALNGILGEKFKKDKANINNGYPILSWQ